MSAAPTSQAARASLIVGIVAVVALVGVLVWGGGDADDLSGAGLGANGPVVDGPLPDRFEDSAGGQDEEELEFVEIPTGPIFEPGGRSVAEAPDVRDLPGGADPIVLSELSDLEALRPCEIFEDEFFRGIVPTGLHQFSQISTQPGPPLLAVGVEWVGSCRWVMEADGVDQEIRLSFDVGGGGDQSAERYEILRQDAYVADDGFALLGPTVAGGDCHLPRSQPVVRCLVDGVGFEVSGPALDWQDWVAQVLVPMANNVASRIVYEP